MTAVVLSPEPERAWSAADRAPLLRWLIFTGATVFAAILLWRYGLLRLMVVSDRTYLSSVIVLIYVGASLHCLWRTIAGLDASDKSMMKSSMGLMSDGMAVAMYTTLAGLVGSILLKIQYYMLDNATAKVFSRAVTLTETRVVPALERAHDLAMRA
jgi:hypothetical protein